MYNAVVIGSDTFEIFRLLIQDTVIEQNLHVKASNIIATATTSPNLY